MKTKNLIIVAISTLLWITPALPARVADNLGHERRLAQQAADKELDQFLQAKEAVFERDWPKARKKLEQFINNFPTGRFRDEALYWLSRSLNGCAVKESSRSAALALNKEAFSTLERLVREHPASAWKNDAEELRIEIAGELVLMGAGEYEGFIREVAASRKADETTLKLTALNSLIRLEPQTAFTALVSALETEGDSRVRRRSATLLGQFNSQEALAVLEKAAQSDSDAGVREEAAYWTEQIRIRLIPADLSYYALAARVTGEAARSRLKEGVVNRFTIQRKPEGLAEARGIISKFFNGQVGSYESWAAERLVANQYVVRSGETSHKLYDFRISIVPGSVRKSPGQVVGEVLFNDLVSGELHSETFSVGTENDQIFAARRGDKAAVIFLHFEPAAAGLRAGSEGEDEESLTGILGFFSRIFGRSSEKKPVYYNLYTNFMGCRVHSQAAAVETDNLTDFGLAKAEIPAKGGSPGTWTLTGHIVAFTKTGTFVARRASLANPAGKRVAVADEIMVTVDDPAGFRVQGSHAADK
jgi:hypothetical protein